jgi:hypothetical protein
VTVIVMQRINDLDLSAHVLATAEEEYVHLKIEAEATGHQVFSFPRSPRVFTREPGDLLWESREGPFEIRRQKAVMGRWKYAAQYQQDPIPEGGSIFQREWFAHRFHRDKDTGIPLGAKLRMVIQVGSGAGLAEAARDRAGILSQRSGRHMTRWIYRLPANQTLLEAIVALEPGQGFVLYAQVFRDGRWIDVQQSYRRPGVRVERESQPGVTAPVARVSA